MPFVNSKISSIDSKISWISIEEDRSDIDRIPLDIRAIMGFQSSFANEVNFMMKDVFKFINKINYF